MNESNTNKLRQIIALKVKRHPEAGEADIFKFVSELLKSEAKLISEWTREYIAVALRREMRARKKEPLPGAGPYQIFLEGFESLAERVPLPGRGKALSRATIVDLRLSLKTARTKGHEQTQRLTALIREMEPYAKTRRDLTVERYCELRAAGVPARVPKNVARNLYDD